MNIFTELKRRNVFKVGVAYLVVAWLLLQVASIVLPTFNAPPWVMQVLLFFMAVGFVLALFLAWAFELTPDGIKPTHTVSRDESITPQTGQKLNRLIISGLSLALVLVVVDSYILTDRNDATADSATAANLQPTAEPAAANSTTEKSIAVLPFINLSSDPEQEYFSDGLTEELIATLSSVDNLLVTGRTSVFYFKGSEQSAAQIADSLGVNHILQGSVRKAGNQLRITTTLMDAASGFNLWTETFDRTLADIFAIQDEIAEAVTKALSVTLGAGEFDRPGMTRNVEAYDLWLQARSLPVSSLPAISQQRIGYLEQAVAVDPGFALAWYALSQAYGGAFSIQNGQEQTASFARGSQAMERARQLAPDMRELLTNSYATTQSFAEFEQTQLQLLAEFGNTDPAINYNYSLLLQLLGRVQESVPYAQRAIRLDPFNPAALFALWQAQASLGRFDEARENMDRNLAMFNNVPGTAAFAAISMLEMMEGNLDAAREAAQNMSAARDFQLNLINWVENGSYEDGKAEIRRLMAAPDTIITLHMRHLAWAAVLMGDPELAVESLLAVPANLPDFAKLQPIMLLWSSIGDEVRPLASFKAVLEERGLADYWQTTGNWPDKCRPLPNSDTDFECF